MVKVSPKSDHKPVVSDDNISNRTVITVYHVCIDMHTVNYITRCLGYRGDFATDATDLKLSVPLKESVCSIRAVSMY